MTVEVGRSYERHHITPEEWDAHEWEPFESVGQGQQLWYCARANRRQEPVAPPAREPHVCAFEPVPIDPEKYPWPTWEQCRCGRSRHIDISEEEIDARLLAMGPEEAARWAAFMRGRVGSGRR